MQRRRTFVQALAGLPLTGPLAWGAGLDLADRFGDGLPGFLRITSPADAANFRAWFSFLAEIPCFLAAGAWQREVADCAALLRFAFRESLRRHDAEWANRLGLPVLPPLADVREVRFPAPRLGDAVFRVRPGPFHPADLAGGAFRAFADAAHLMRCNAHRIAAAIEAARSGDLLFYRQLAENQPFHSMVYIGDSVIQPEAQPVVAYHTGPQGGAPGGMRRLLLSELLEHREPRWRPLVGNPNFLGVFRWNLLRDSA